MLLVVCVMLAIQLSTSLAAEIIPTFPRPVQLKIRLAEGVLVPGKDIAHTYSMNGKNQTHVSSLCYCCREMEDYCLDLISVLYAPRSSSVSLLFAVLNTVQHLPFSLLPSLRSLRAQRNVTELMASSLSALPLQFLLVCLL